MTLLQKLKVFFSRKCPFRFQCDFYQPEGDTCNGKNLTFEKGFDYCGCYRTLNKAERKIINQPPMK